MFDFAFCRWKDLFRPAPRNASLAAGFLAPGLRFSLVGLLLVAAAGPVRAEATAPAWPPVVEDFTLTECRGREVSREDLLGRPWLASFVFTHCLGPCPVVTQRVKELHDRFPDLDIRFVSFTVDPARDTEEVLCEYAAQHGADPERWWFLRGDQRTVYGLIHRSFRLPVQETLGKDRKPGFEIIHSTNIMYVDAEGRVVGKYDAQDDVAMVKLRRVLEGKEEPSFTGAPLPGPSSGSAGLAPAGASAESADGESDPAAAPAGGAAARAVPEWVLRLPAVNASLNALAGVLLVVGVRLIRAGRRNAHEAAMLGAFATSSLFLACYLVYHFALHEYTGRSSRPFEGTGPIRPVYFTILVSHVLLAFTVPVLALVTIYRGLRGQWPEHRRIARITYPIWLYVSVTGVIIYLMLYHGPWNAG